MADILFGTQSAAGRSPPITAERLINAYAEAAAPGAKTPVAVYGTPGIGDFATLGAGPVRGFFEMNGILYAVSSDEFYEIDSDGAETVRGSGITGGAPVSIEGNGSQIEIVNGTAGYTYTPSTTTFAAISDPDFEVANTIAFLGGYFALDRKDTNQFGLSDLLDGTSYSALMYASAETSPDRILSVVNNHGVLLLVGERTIEPWDHTGASSFPFQRFTGSTPSRGIAAPLAYAREDNTVFLFGNDRVFYRLAGITPIRVSTHQIESLWQDYTTVSDAFCFTFGHDGHKFVALTFPTESKTWVFDIATGRWHERITYDAGGNEVRWRVNCAISAYGKTLFGDANSGKVGYLDTSLYTEFGDQVRMMMVFPPIHGQGKRVFMPHFALDVEAGVGTATGDGSDPQYMLDYSDDGGRTYTAPQQWRSAGAIGEYQQRLHWRQLGSFYQRVIRVQISDPVKRVVIAARCDGLYAGM